MASRDTSLQDHNFSREDLALIAKSLKDEKFRALFNEYAKEVTEPDNQKQLEKEVKQLEKERGVEAVFVHPRPGFALLLGSLSSDAYVYVNICSSDVVQRPSFVRVNEGGKQGQNWSLPHALPKPRQELLGEEGVTVSGEEGLAREGVKVPGGEGLAEVAGVPVGVKKALVHDVVFHPDALQLAARRPIMKRTIINSAMDSLSKTFNVKSAPWQEVENVKYVGVPVQSVIKRVMDKNLFEKSDCMSFQPLDERTCGKQKKYSKTNCDGNVSMSTKALVRQDEPVAPVCRIKHVSKMDLQDYTVQMIPQYKQPWRPQALEIEIELPGVNRASQVDANVWQQSIFLLTESTPKYKIELPLPYPVNEDTSAAKFDVSTQKLTLTLTVIPADKKHLMNMEDNSPSSDSGIELEPDYRTNSDVDNSSEASVSSQEEAAQRETIASGEEEDCVFEPEQPYTTGKVYLLPSYTVKHNKKNLVITLNCGNVLPSSVKTEQLVSEMASVELSSMGGGQALLHYRLKIDCSPHHIATSGVAFKLEEKQVLVTLKKAVPGQWKSCQMGLEDSMVTVELAPVASLDGEEDNISKQQIVLKPDEEGKTEDGKSSLGGARPPRMSRTVSMCETDSAHNTTFRLRGPTCSWPRGILKQRSRSLSESQVGADFSALSLGSTNSSIDMDSKVDGEDEGEESVEEGISSSFGEKKSVRFNEVVSKQLFRSNSSILGQRAKNQKKAMKKRKGQSQRSANSSQESGRDITSDGLTTSTDEDTDATTTDATEDLDDVSLTADDMENNNLNSNSSNMSVMNQNYHESIKCSSIVSNSDDNSDIKNEEDYDSGFILKTNKKKKRNKKNKANFEPSNNLIFQLDIDK